MVRTQVQLTEEQALKLEEVATANRISKAEVVRQALERFFGQEAPISRAERMRRATEVFGKYRSGYSDVSTNHDEHLAEIYGQW